ncbi:putative metalloprotease CJM1_0395 family protein [Pseudaeromonas pectinilytica]
MNIAPSYPNFVPLALQPAVEAARRDSQQRELIPAAQRGDAYAKESQVGSEKDRARNNDNRPVTYQPESGSRASTSQQDVAAVNDEQQGRQQGQGQGSGQSGGRSSSGDEQTKRQQQAEQLIVDSLKQRDREVRAHEQAHQAVGGQYASAPSFTMQSGPDGGRYATGGEVQIDISAEANPAATIRKMQQVQAAALAPVDPSGQDHAVAAKAAQMAMAARAELQSQGASASAPKTQDGDSTASTNVESSPVVSRSRSYVQESLTDLMTQRGQVISRRYELAWQPEPESQLSRYA